MRIGLLLGSFDPIHNGHVMMAEKVWELGLVDKVFFVPSAQNPWKERSTNFLIRCAMIQRAIGNRPEFFMSPVEVQLDEPYYTYKTLERLQELHPTYQFNLIVGADVAATIKDWENGNWILENFPLIVLSRPGYDSDNSVPLEVNVSSTQVRTLTKNGESIDHLVHPGVKEIIECIKLYKNE